ncbi:hypothetical protein [Glaciecola petra]|uniref:Uncharacterized protein n=1 Tax=Glaciecola petra TaxID=3075602 RepID=A0ABU2ZWM4_9ALTE|nr:hypothetical protein [Aestuariibacter sp. P117]MDT0595969.1 hypothetical protein [Aestuariibacter sp. P117]
MKKFISSTNLSSRNSSNRSCSKSCSKLSLLVALLLVSAAAVCHDGHHNKLAWQACDEKKQQASCSYILKTNRLHQGFCREVAEDLMCVRTQPIRTLSDNELSVFNPTKGVTSIEPSKLKNEADTKANN